MTTGGVLVVDSTTTGGSGAVIGKALACEMKGFLFAGVEACEMKPALLGAGDQGWPAGGGTGGGAFGGDISPASTGSSSYEPPKLDKRCAAPPMAEVALTVMSVTDSTRPPVMSIVVLERRRTKSAIASLASARRAGVGAERRVPTLRRRMDCPKW